MTVQRLRLYCLAHQDFGYVQISLGNTAMAVGACMQHRHQMRMRFIYYSNLDVWQLKCHTLWHSTAEGAFIGDDHVAV